MECRSCTVTLTGTIAPPAPPRKFSDCPTLSSNALSSARNWVTTCTTQKGQDLGRQAQSYHLHQAGA